MDIDPVHSSKELSACAEHSLLSMCDQCSFSTNSHDSLLQSEHQLPGFVDDLTAVNQLSSFAFHSKDSALDLSDENLHRRLPPTDSTLVPRKFRIYSAAAKVKSSV